MSSATAAPAETTITMKVADCDGCTITPTLAWVVPTVATTGGFGATQRGTIANQEAWYCPKG
jgi:hypothetical protein